jgi:hypothetical protein
VSTPARGSRASAEVTTTSRAPCYRVDRRGCHHDAHVSGRSQWRTHHSYLYLSAAGPAASGNPDLLHVPESDGTYNSSLAAAGRYAGSRSGISPAAFRGPVRGPELQLIPARRVPSVR